MANHPLNLGIRFLLELCTLAIGSMWGWQRGDGWTKPALAIGIPLLIALLWGTFRVPGDPGKAPVAIPGALRLVLECAVFGFAVWALFDRVQQCRHIFWASSWSTNAPPTHSIWC